MMKRQSGLTTGVFIVILLMLPALKVTGQNCEVDFPGTATRTFSSTCGGTTSGNVRLGQNIYMGNGDVFTFDRPLINIFGNLFVNAQGGGKIVIPAGVTVNVFGNFQIDAQNSGCSAANPCVFEIEVNGRINFWDNLRSNIMTLVWSGTGDVLVDENFGVSASGCMQCGPEGCPDFQVDLANCRDEGSGCPGTDFCELINACLSDLTRPVITGCPGNMVVNLTGPGCTQTVSWIPPTASDACRLVSFVTNKAPGSVFAKGITTVIYTARDAAGNTATCSFDVNVIDNITPVITGCPADITVSTDATCQAVVNWTAPAFTDNCTGGTLVTTKAPGSTFEKGITIVTYTATDASGNTATCAFNVNVIDNVTPVITGCPADITVNTNAACQAVVNWTAPTFTDNCTGGTLTTTKAPGSTFEKGVTTVTYTATDASGNVATCSFNVNVIDNVAPVITGCPADILVNTNATSCQAVVNWTAPAFTDNCTGGTITSTKVPGSTFEKGITTVTYTATDASGNIASCSFKVNVIDNVAPVITGCPADITVNTNASCQAVVNWTAPTIADNCTGGTITATKAPGSTFEKGITMVTYTATDASGNTASCSFNVNVVDNVAPVITGCPADITVTANASCQAVVNWTAPTFTDNCPGGILTSNKSPGSTFEKGTTIVTYTATDASVNTATCSFKVTVVDNVAPRITGCPANITVTAINSCSMDVNWTAPVATDNCNTVTMTGSHRPGDTFSIGQTEVKYTATDQQGNVSVCSFHVIVKPGSPPIISNCPANISLNADEAGIAKASWVEPTATTRCGQVTITSSHRPGDQFRIGTTEIEYKATDESGNSAFCYFSVVVSKTEIEIDIAKIVTPDGNGTNDEWILTNIEKFKNNKVVVVDRWGGLVFSGTGYNNQDVVWRGTNNSGGPVPSGTYFYSISIRYGSADFQKTGFIELVR